MNKIKKNIKKVGISTLGIVVANIALTAPTFANILGPANNFIKEQDSVPITISQAAEDMSPVTNILFTIATAVLVVVGLVMGIKYMMSEPNDKAKMKEKLIYYFIAIILVYAGIAIASLVANFISATTSTSTTTTP